MDYKLKEDLEMFQSIKGLTNEDLAEILNTSTMNIWRWKNNKAKPSETTLKGIYDKIFSSGVDLNSLKEEMYKSKENSNTKIVFHGSKSGIDGELTIKRGDVNRDFGQAFYTGENVEQAVSFVCFYPDSSLYIMEFDTSNLKIKNFEVTKEWMTYIAYSRGKLNEYKESKYIKKVVDEVKDYDVVIAPIADNTMYDILNDFTRGFITDEQCLNALSANRLGKQIVFLNDEALKHLKVLEHCFISDIEREHYTEVKRRSTDIGIQKSILERRKYAAKGKYVEELYK